MRFLTLFAQPFIRMFARAAVLALVTFALSPATAFADDAPTMRPSPQPSPISAAARAEQWNVHAQVTNLQQYHGAFPAAYSGAQSLSPNADTAKTFDFTAFVGTRLWKEAALYVNPEIDQGFGLSGTFGVAGYPSGEAYKVGAQRPYGRLQRYFVRQTLNYGGGAVRVDSDQNQLGESVDANRLVLTFGKYSVVDMFDNNAYAHDPKNDFMNWSIIDMGAFDYAADAWGYTRGLAAEYTRPHSTLRAGIFQLSVTPNTTKIEPAFLRQFSPIVEFEKSTSFFGEHPGKIRALAYGDYGYMAPLADATSAVAGTTTPPDVTALRTSKHWKLGGGINVEQELATNVGFFARLSAQNGSYETFDFTEIDRSVSGGFVLNGRLWKRQSDAFGIAYAANTLSTPHKQYLAAGGLGILIGDGNLSYAGESVVETYYRVSIGSAYSITGDYQRIHNPAYNAARGPVSVLGLRVHAQM